MQIGGRTRRLLTLMMALEVVLCMAAVGVLAAGPGPALASDARHLKVVIVVGPVGGLTDSYRALADEAAAAARARTDNVTTIYSPNATWPAVRRALKGASIVVYLGHGNGWPSPYRNALYRTTQNGLGLNPVAGVDDEAHQYFGERYLARDVKLAKGAVVILGHLCYASGNPEPGGPEPSLDVAEQRADNYAAGWMAAGATAVVAEGHGRPAWYVTTLLKGRGTIEGMWRSAPTFHDHVIEIESARTSGSTLMLDPDHRRSGYFRSLTVVPGARVADSLAAARTVPAEPSATPSPSATALTAEQLSPAARGARFGAPLLDGRTVAATETTLTIPVKAATLKLLPDDVYVGTRWDPMIPITPRKAQPATAGASSAQGAPAAAIPSPKASEPPMARGPIGATRPGSESASTVPIAPESSPVVESPAPPEPPLIDLIGPEAPGAELAVAPATRIKAGLTAPVTVPTQPGLYRLVTTIHDGEGVAYDAETQNLIPALLIRVTAPLSATYGLPDELERDAGKAMTVRVRVANTGTESWGRPTAVSPTTGEPIGADVPPLLVARWVSLDDYAAQAVAAPSAVVRADVGPGQESVFVVALVTPAQPGRYLLLFDLQTEDGVSFASIGVPPGITRVVVDQPSPGLDPRRPARGGR